jgi:hypothetical protein
VAVDTVWSDPTTLARASGTILPYSNYEDLLSNVNRLGGADGNAKLGTWLIDQATDDGIILSGASTGDVAHGMTDLAPTAVFFAVQKTQGANGGATIRGFSDAGMSGSSLVLDGFSTDAPPTTPNASSYGVVRIGAHIKSGTTKGPVGANGICLSVETNGTVLLTVDAEGDLSVNGSGTLGTFDHHEHKDHRVARTIRALLAAKDSKLRKDHEALVTEYGQEITEARIVTVGPDGVPFANVKRLSLFTLDALYQLGERLDALEAQLAGLAPGGRP